jgi:hypothetical protein
MAFGFIGKLTEAIMNGPEGADSASMSILGIDSTDPKGSTVILPERTFQFWPESIQDSIEIGWQFKDIPGGSHALAQWGSNNGRTISFEVRLHRFMKPVDDRTIFEKIMDPIGLTTPGQQYLKDMRPHNVDIESEIRYLRAFCYPSYAVDNVSGSTVSYSPPVAMLCVPGVGLNELGSHTIMAVMTGCDVTYNLLFPNGKPRNATVALTFKQIVQKADVGVMWRGIGKDAAINGYKHRIPDIGYNVNAYTAGNAKSAKEPWTGAGGVLNKIDTKGTT